jgi:UDP-N-acetylenolpyruvoylglucosamine reductase
MDEKLKLLEERVGRNRLKLHESLKHQTLSQLPAVAQIFFLATTKVDLREILDAAFDLKIPYWIIGAGSKFNFAGPQIPGLVIKNRTNALKIGAVKGKVGRGGIGVEEATIEVDSGVSIGKLNQFLETQHLETVGSSSHADSTLGGTIWSDFALQFYVQSVVVWKNGQEEEIEVKDLDKSSQVVLSVVLKMKAK